MEFSKKDKELLAMCVAEPNKYEISVDNDCISVHGISNDDFYQNFEEFGYYFIVQILKHLGCNADFC